jgi:hypothetical protein
LTRGPQVRIYGRWIQEEIFTFNPIILEIADRTGSHIRNRVTGRNSVLALFFPVVSITSITSMKDMKLPLIVLERWNFCGRARISQVFLKIH